MGISLLPLFRDATQNFETMQSKWKSILDVLIKNPLSQGTLISNVQLVQGVNVINHKLGRVQQGWFFVDKQAYGMVYRSAPFNSTTLTLTASTAQTVSLWVF